MAAPVPDDQKARLEVALQVFEELHDLRALRELRRENLDWQEGGQCSSRLALLRRPAGLNGRAMLYLSRCDS